MALSRREFLKGAAVTAGALAIPTALAPRARAAGGEPVLVSIFLRGAADGLGLVVPHGDPHYYEARPGLAVPKGTELDLDGFFGFHPELAPLLPIYRANRLAVLHAVGSPDPSRSHFDAQDFAERAAPGDFSVYDGWLNRYLKAIGSESSLAAVTIGNAKALSLAGDAPSLAFWSLADLRLAGRFATQRRAALEQIYQSVQATLLGRSAGEFFGGIDQVAAIRNDSAVAYPDTPFARSLRDVAALIRADLGLRVVALDLDGWDHHESGSDGMYWMAKTLAEGLAAFDRDLGAAAGRTLVVTTTEFGRTLAENGSGGSEHGHGSVAFVMGGAVHGGRVLLRNGQWPGLARAQLFEEQDLAVTTDFRDLFAELLHRHMGLPALAPILPGYPVSASRYPGLFA